MPRTPIHPGEILQDELEELGISPAELARNLKVPTNRITGILNGRKQYELHNVEKESGAEIRRLPPPQGLTKAVNHQKRESYPRT